jgi:hypothetical protein
MSRVPDAIASPSPGAAVQAPALWIAHYMGDRVEALHDELAQIEAATETIERGSPVGP